MEDRARLVCEGCGGVGTHHGRFCEPCLNVDDAPVLGGFVPCDCCGGSGEHIRHDDTARPCTSCEGHGTVWSDAA